jgi:hypothetical protein
MSHVRTQIRNAVVAALAGLPTTQGRVFSGRTHPLGKVHLPTLLIYATEEVSDADTMGSAPILLRTLTLSVEGRAVTVGPNAARDIEETLDRIAAEVEAKIVADPSLDGLTKEITLTATRINAQSPGESHAGEVRMEYRVLYRTAENAPATAV